jgi:iron complex transport system ATP-binding protein
MPTEPSSVTSFVDAGSLDDSKSEGIKAPHPEPVLACKGLCVLLDQELVLKDLHLSLPRATWLSVVGPNGAGKSTLLKALAGLQSHLGEVELKGQALKTWDSRVKAQQLTWMGQEGAFVDDLRAWDVVRLGRLPFQKTWSWTALEQETEIHQAMALTHTWDLKERVMGTLSAGQAQRVLLARAFCTQSDVLLLDEPVVALDPPFQSLFINWMRALVAKGVTVVSVLHDLNLALNAQSMLILNQGEQVFMGSTQSHELHRALESVFADRVRVLDLSALDLGENESRYQVVLKPPPN